MFGIKKVKVSVEVSARHCHLSQTDLETLFGVGYELKKLKQLSQPSDFACEEAVGIRTQSGILQKVRVVGPVRAQTQVEVSRTDAVSLGANPPIKLSGDLQGSAAVALVGPKGEVELSEGLIIARRHLHCATETAKNAKLRNGQIVSVEIKGERAVIFNCVEVRVKDEYKLCLHLDTDEGNAAGINKIGEGFIII